jgi:hypothetical protein
MRERDGTPLDPRARPPFLVNDMGTRGAWGWNRVGDRGFAGPDRFGSEGKGALRGGHQGRSGGGGFCGLLKIEECEC